MRAKDTINQLKEEISNLSKLVEKGAGLSMGQENMVKELIKVRDELATKNEEQSHTIAVSPDQLYQNLRRHAYLSPTVSGMMFLTFSLYRRCFVQYRYMSTAYK